MKAKTIAKKIAEVEVQAEVEVIASIIMLEDSSTLIQLLRLMKTRRKSLKKRKRKKRLFEWTREMTAKIVMKKAKKSFNLRGRWPQ